MTKIKLTLTDAAGRVGTCYLGAAEPMTWDGNEDDGGETESALFEAFDADGKLDDSAEISGDEWRELESEGMGPDYVAFWVQRGVSLFAAVEACRTNNDPHGFDRDYEEAVAEREEQIAELRAALADVLPYAESRGEDLEGYAQSGDEDANYPGAPECTAAIERAGALLTEADHAAACARRQAAFEARRQAG